MSITESSPVFTGNTRWPAGAIQAIFALGISGSDLIEKRKLPRSSYAVDIQVLLQGGDFNVTAYTHSVSPEAVSFVIDHALPIGRRGRLHIPRPDGHEMELGFVILRCRKLSSGWFDISAHFQRRQPAFAEFNFT